MEGKVVILPEGEVDKCCGGERSAGDGGTDVEHGWGDEDKEEKTEQAQGTSRTDASFSHFLIFKKKADGDGWCEIVQHKGAWDIGWDVEDPGSGGPEDEVWEDLKVEGKDQEFAKRRDFGLLSTIEELKGIENLTS
jgi:hypothetical protein